MAAPTARQLRAFLQAANALRDHVADELQGVCDNELADEIDQLLANYHRARSPLESA